MDQTSDSEPRGGINKDGVDSEHGHLHTQAAQTAIAATTELLLDIREAAGDADFLRWVKSDIIWILILTNRLYEH